MAFGLRYHPRVLSHDVPRIPSAMRERVGRGIDAKLRSDPAAYGVPLRGTLLGYRKLRVGDYRVVFEIVGDTVRILAVAHRKDVYALPRGEMIPN